MESHRVFCSACDRDVTIMLTDAPLFDGPITLHDEEVICLEIGDKCTGNLCPLGAVEPNAMVGRIIRNGLPTDNLRTLRSACPACSRETEMVLYGDGRAACTECGSPARWTVDHAEPLS
jgi:ribosomal protein S27AE